MSMPGSQTADRPRPPVATMSQAEVQAALARAVATVRATIPAFREVYPDDTTVGGRYLPRSARDGFPQGANVGWTTGFVPGMQWIAAEIGDDPVFTAAALEHLDNFEQRARAHQDLDHHDLGFLYHLAAVTAWRQVQQRGGREAGLLAAEALMTRFVEPAGVFQAWGSLQDPQQSGRTIVDSLMNMPLLVWASQTTGEPRYREAALRHINQLATHMVRDDGSTYHTFTWDAVTGVPLHGNTAQGAGDGSCWARGQAWAIYGFALAYRIFGLREFRVLAERCAEVFWVRLPPDLVPYWDLDFGAGSGEPRDSSAGAIAVCGLLELASTAGDPASAELARNRAGRLLAALVRDCAPAAEQSDALLLHGVYSKPGNAGVDEGNLWGDYFYLEALARTADPGWEPIWCAD
ncbi:glycoside hydrolase family 88 protein [Enemella evansiae]|uniref:glycoside hydrolase family 88 protein n=1 Tax=Enemella evansiae TaxID=2016499 RepID=UPI001AADB40E|nr:glycoside hydrolase family 88 protein [Enemella evansiae]